MDNLRQIWTKLHEAQMGIEALMTPQSTESLIQQVKQEEQKRKRYTKWMIPTTVLIVIGISSIVLFSKQLSNTSIDSWQLSGLILIVLGVVWMIGQFVYTQIPFQESNYEQQSTTFLQLAYQKLQLRKQLTVWGSIIYLLLLIPGILMVAWVNLQKIPGYLGIIGLTIGIMFGLAGYIIWVEQKKFNRTYGNILQKIKRFLSHE
ncbi:hypothetical protein [Tunicatimonas pelagia]|uniref:hypothetical protein n=1 Tax=Tunicatimonas pelagia TaxID=931531 RepID=UPI002665BE39|nr:hypothetical protein [Tunicatimonas pelagia]WKN46249.1 hypothetical protein P0M28_14955 [Tunicatimonas pelagia]